MGKKRQRKGADEDQGESRSRKTRTGKKKQPDGVSDYAVRMAGGASIQSIEEFESLTGIPAELALSSEKDNQERRHLHYALDQLKQRKSRSRRDPQVELRGSFITDEKRKKFIQMFQELHEKRGYGATDSLTIDSLDPMFYGNPSEIALPSEPSLMVDPLLMLSDEQAFDLCKTAAYQEFEILVQPHRKTGQFALSSERKERLDQAGWTVCPDAIQPDSRFITEFFVSRDGLWGLYIMQQPLEDEPTDSTAIKGLNVAYYLYVPRLATC
ncbi:MAG: hypothetical protein CMP20_02715 [Rickettsiales bacterium]|nr:hypothetical protein [Rickettsiales bacterium]